MDLNTSTALGSVSMNTGAQSAENTQALWDGKNVLTMLNTWKKNMQLFSEPLFWLLMGILSACFIVYFIRVQHEIKKRQKKINELLITNDTVQIVHEYKRQEAQRLEHQRDGQRLEEILNGTTDN